MKRYLLLLAVLVCLSAVKLDIEELKQRGFALAQSKFGDVLMTKEDGLSTESVPHFAMLGPAAVRQRLRRSRALRRLPDGSSRTHSSRQKTITAQVR